MGAVYEPGAVLLDKYRVDRVLGEGGMGIVVAATHLELQEQVALKFLLPEASANPEIAQRFVREAKAAVRLRGEHVARVSDVGKLPGGLPYMVMEYLDGTDLEGLLAQRLRLPPGEAVDYVLQACEALAEAHAAGIVHRDIKPANLFVSKRPDGSPMIKVLDFGISKITTKSDARLTRTQAVMGTPAYMSPEQLSASHNVDGRTDIWALGIVLYQTLAGVRPFTADAYPALILQIAGEPVPPMSVPLPPGLESVVLRCLEKDVRHRYPSISELASDLAPFSRDRRSADVMIDRIRGMLPPREHRSTEVARPDHSPPSTLNVSAGAIESIRRTKRYALGGLVLGLAVAGLVVFFLTRGFGKEAGTAPVAPAAPSGAVQTDPLPPPPLSPPSGAAVSAGAARSTQTTDAATLPPAIDAATSLPAAAAADLTAPTKTEIERPKPPKPPRIKPSPSPPGAPGADAARAARTNTTPDAPARALDPPTPKTESAPAPSNAEPPSPDDPRALLRRRK